MKYCLPNPRKKEIKIETAIGQLLGKEKLLHQLSRSLRGNKKIVLTAVVEDGHTLQHASKKLKNNKEIVLAAVSQNGYALYHASDALQEDKEIVLAAGAQNGYVLEHASDALKTDPVINTQITYMKQQSCRTGKKLRNLHTMITQENLKRAHQRLALAKLLHNTLGLSDLVPDIETDIIEKIGTTPPLTPYPPFSSFVDCIDTFRRNISPDGIHRKTTTEDLIEIVQAVSENENSKTEALRPST